MRQSDYKKAYQLLSQNRSFDKNNANIKFLLAYLKLKNGKPEESIQIIEEELVGKFLLLEDYLFYYLALSYSKDNNHKNALKNLTALKKKYPNTAFSIELDLAIINENIALNNTKTAITLINQFIKKNKHYKNMPKIWFLLGKGYEDINQLSKAYEAYKKITIKFPLDKLAPKAKKHMDAIKKRSKQKIVPPSSKEKFRMAKGLMRGGKSKKAIGELKSVIKSSSDRELKIKAEFNLGVSYISLGNPKRGIKILNSLARRIGRHRYTPQIYYKLARTYWNKGASQKALNSCHRILKNFPQTKWAQRALLLIGKINEEKKNRKKAVQYYQKVIKYNKKGDDVPEASFRIGWLYYKNKIYKKAISAFQKTINEFGSSNYSISAMYWLGRSYENMKNFSKAEKIFAKLTDHYPYSFYGRVGSLNSKRLKTQNKKSMAKKNVNFHEHEIYKNLSHYSFNISNLPGLNKKTTHINLKVDALMALGFIEQAQQEVNLIKKYIKKNDLKSILWLNSVYYKVYGFKPYFDNLHKLVSINNHKKNPKALPGVFWNMYYPLGYWEEIIESSRKNDIDPFLILGLIRQESVFNYKAISRVGAKGLMQLMMSTAKREVKHLKMNIELNDYSLFDSWLNITLGTYHFKSLMKKFDNNLTYALIAYNAGSRKVFEWKKRFPDLEEDEFIECIPYPETRNFVKRVMENYFNYQFLYSDSF